MSYSFIKNIDSAECLFNTRLNINANYTSLYEGCKVVDTSLTNTEYMSKSVIDSALSTVKFMNALMSAKVHDIKMSLSETNKDSNVNIISDTIYIHPFIGDGISLYSYKYSSWLKRVVGPKALPFKLVDSNNKPLLANTNYDIFLSYNDVMSSFNLTFVKWKDNTSNTTYSQGVCVLSDTNSLDKRYLGCLRTTQAGTTELSFGGVANHGAHPKLFLWNFKNRTPKIISSITTAEYDSTQLDTWTRTSAINETIDTFNDNRVDLITGDIMYLDFRYQNYFECTEETTVHSGLAVNSVNSVAKLYNTICTTNTITAQGWGSTISSLQGTVPRGVHFIQTFDKTNKYVRFNTVHNDIFKTGFTGTILI